jgi:hypothetical protein
MHVFAVGEVRRFADRDRVDASRPLTRAAPCSLIQREVGGAPSEG